MERRESLVMTCKRTIKNGRSGFISVYLAAAMLIVTGVGVTVMFTNSRRNRLVIKMKEDAFKRAGFQLYSLIDRPFNSAQLAGGSHAGPANSGLSWAVQEIGPREKRIIVRAKLIHPVTGYDTQREIRLQGYKFYDF